MEKVRFFALGGVDENGKNSFVFEACGNLFIINAGAMVPLNTSLGVDTVIPKVDCLFKYQKKLKAIFITDVKNESFSALPWYAKQLWRVPIYSSSFNCQVIAKRLKKYNMLSEEYDLREIPSFLKFGRISVTSFYIAGSLPQQIGLNFYTPQGDFTFILNSFVGKSFNKTDFNYIKEKVLRGKNPKALFLDCGKSNLLEKTANKCFVTPLIEKFFEPNKQSRIILACYDEDVYAMQEAIKLAINNQKEIFIYGRSAMEYQESLKHLNLSDYCDFITPLHSLKKSQNCLIIVATTVEKLYVRLRRIANNQDAILHLRERDLFINIAPPINGFEVYATDVMDLISMQVRDIFQFDEQTLYRMRPAKEDIYNFCRELKPEFFIPLQGLYRYLFDAMLIASNAGVNKNKIPILKNGKVISWDLSGFNISKNLITSVGNNYIDGLAFGSINERVLKEREALSRDGVIIISALISQKTKELVSDLKINSAGILTGEKRSEAVEICKNTIFEFIQKIGPTFNHFKNIQRIKNAIKRKIFKRFDKEPVIIINFYPIEV